jgi:hypothetical protein
MEYRETERSVRRLLDDAKVKESRCFLLLVGFIVVRMREEKPKNARLGLDLLAGSALESLGHLRDHLVRPLSSGLDFRLPPHQFGKLDPDFADQLTHQFMVDRNTISRISREGRVDWLREISGF